MPQQVPGRVRCLRLVQFKQYQHRPSFLQAFVLLREFILGSNPTGLVTTSHGHTTVVGGEDSGFRGVISGQLGIFGGSSSTQFTFTYPAATIAAWNSFIATAAITPPSVPTGP